MEESDISRFGSPLGRTVGYKGSKINFKNPKSYTSKYMHSIGEP